MSGSVATRITRPVHTQDPKDVIRNAIKTELLTVKPTSGDVLLGVYERPEKAGSIIIPETASRRSEDAFQGVVGLIVAIGPEFHKHKKALGLDPMPKVGDWVLFRNQDTVAFFMGEGVNTKPMRLLQGDFIRMVLTDPDVLI